MSKRPKNPFAMGYGSNMDASPELSPDAASYFQSINGFSRWMVELGRIDIITKLSFSSSHLALHKEGHLDTTVHVMAYMGHKYTFTLVYN